MSNVADGVELHGRDDAEWHFGRAVRQARGEHGWTQADLAEHMSRWYTGSETYTQSTVAKTEAASRPIRLNEASALAFVLRRDLTQMVRRPGPRKELLDQRSQLSGQLRDLDRRSQDIDVEILRVREQLEKVEQHLATVEREEEAGRGVDREET